MWKPCANSTPISARAASTLSFSTLSATVRTPMMPPMRWMVSTIAKSMGSVLMLRMNAPSIFRKSMGRLRRYENEDMPLPKSSSAIGQPRARSRVISAEACARFATAAVSVSSMPSWPALRVFAARQSAM